MLRAAGGLRVRAWTGLRSSPAAVLLGCASLAGCGPETPEPPADPVAARIADRSITDEEALRGPASRLRKLGEFGGGSEIATVATDAQGRPVLRIRYQTGILNSSLQFSVEKAGEAWTPEAQRRRDISEMNMSLGMSGLQEVLRVGAARNLQQIDVLMVVKVSTPEGDRVMDVLKAVVPRAGVEALAASAETARTRTGLDLSAHWTVEFDRFDQLEVRPLR